MHGVGLLVLTKHVSSLCHGDYITKILGDVKKVVCSTLYVHLQNVGQPIPNHFQSSKVDEHIKSMLGVKKDINHKHAEMSPCIASDVVLFLIKFYSEAAKQCQHLDVNILLHNIGNKPGPVSRLHGLHKSVHCIVSDVSAALIENADYNQQMRDYVKSHFFWDNCSNQVLIPVLGLSSVSSYAWENSSKELDESSVGNISTKGSVVLGGTFDHIHIGHKILLSEATILASTRLLIGVTSEEMVKRKTLYELIQPWEHRACKLKKFLTDVADFEVDSNRHSLDGHCRLLDVVKIDDPIGPAATDPDLQCIVVSKETQKGGDVVNDARIKNNLNPLHVHVIGRGALVEDDAAAGKSIAESKISSSTLRYNTLGTLRQPAAPRLRHAGAYVIGLTGGIAAGKSSIARRLAKIGARVIDCDKLGHRAYEPGTATFDRVVETFGNDVIGADGAIDRRALATKVFSAATTDKRSDNLTLLNGIVWPEIERMAEVEIAKFVDDGYSCGQRIVCVLDAAVLLEAGWDRMVDEVWVSIVPTDEAVRRVVTRDKRSAGEAQQRIASQLTNSQRVAKAHVVLSTLWSTDNTQNQVEKAWHGLLQRLANIAANHGDVQHHS